MTQTKDRFLIGLIGDHINHSGSPHLHEAEARALGLRMRYSLVDFADQHLSVEDLDDALRWGARLGFDGFNITHPYKQAVVPLLDTLSDEARALGSVNTVVLRAGQRMGHNTDWAGFAQNMAEGLPNADLSTTTLIGAGGAGIAVGFAVLKRGAQTLRIYDQSTARRDATASKLASLFPDRTVCGIATLDEALAGCTGIIQATPLGMSLHPGVPFDPALIPAGVWVADLIYTPEHTAFLKAAAAQGNPILTGVGMAVHQAAIAFQLFTNTTPQPERMRESLIGLRG